jgi:tetratricopeptide (TPR) repeat protein
LLSIRSFFFGKIRRVHVILLVTLSANITLAHMESHQQIEVVRKAIKGDPSNKELALRHAMLLRECEHFEEALRELNELIDSGSNIEAGYYQRALTYKQMNRLILAEGDFSQALALGGRPDTIHRERAEVRERLGQHQGAREDYEIASKFNQLPTFYLDRGSFLIRLGDMESAADYYEQGLKRTNALAILSHYINLESQRHNYEHALSLVNSAIKPDRFNARWLLVKAEIYERKGDLNKAHQVRLKALKECEQWKMNHRYTTLHRVIHADVMRALGKLDQAETEINEIMKISPELIDAKTVKEKILLIRVTNSRTKKNEMNDAK